MQLKEAQWQELLLSARIQFFDDDEALLILTGFALGIGISTDKRILNVKKVKVQAYKDVSKFLIKWFSDHGMGSEITKLMN